MTGDRPAGPTGFPTGPKRAKTQAAGGEHLGRASEPALRSEGPDSPLRNLPVQFVGSFPNPAVPLDPPLPEIGFLGRSNVGKSSLLNALLGRRSLARVSGTPGKTTALNVYRMPDFYLVDLPGYGFAHAAKSARLEFRRLIERYLEREATLAGIVWLLDIRHAPSADDRRFREILAQRGVPMLLVLTKADKLGRAAQSAQQRVIAEALGLAEDQVQPTSSRTGLGIVDLGSSILAVAGQ